MFSTAMVDRNIRGKGNTNLEQRDLYSWYLLKFLYCTLFNGYLHLSRL